MSLTLPPPPPLQLEQANDRASLRFCFTGVVCVLAKSLSTIMLCYEWHLKIFLVSSFSFFCEHPKVISKEPVLSPLILAASSLKQILSCCCSVPQSCTTLCDPMNAAECQASLSFTASWSLLRLGPRSRLVLCPRLLPEAVVALALVRQPP